jgi:elongation factor 1-gamma
LETILHGKEWLVGGKLTLADIFVAIYVSRGLEWVLDGKWREKHPNIIKHFEGVAAVEAVKKIIPVFTLIKEETANENPYN